MATQNKFVIEYGLTVGSTEVITSSGKIVAAAISDLTTDNLTEGSSNQYYANSLYRNRNIQYNEQVDKIRIMTKCAKFEFCSLPVLFVFLSYWLCKDHF